MRELTNLLSETLESMQAHGLTPADVIWVGAKTGEIGSPWEVFEDLAQGTDYYGGHGGEEIVMDLVVVFKDGTWLERAEYDGAEWWEYKQTPSLHTDARPLEVVKPGGYSPRLVPMQWD